jgi:hypothetical protein
MTRIKDITFEGGSLTGTNGFDSTSSVTLDSTSKVKGTYSALADAVVEIGTEDYTAISTVYVSAIIYFTALPASTQCRVLQIKTTNTVIAQLYVNSSGKVQLRDGTTQVGSDSTLTIAINTPYRIGIRYTAGTGANGILEGYAVADGAVWGSPFASTSASAKTATTNRVTAGLHTSSTVATLYLDNIRIDDAALPTNDVAGTTFNQSVNVTVANTTTVAKLINKGVSITKATAVTKSAQVNKPINVTVSKAVTVQKQVSKGVAITAGNVVSLLRASIFLKAITVSVGNLVALSRSVNKSIPIPVSNSVTVARQIAKNINAVVNNTTSLSKVIDMSILVSSSVDITIQRQVAKVIPISVAEIATVTKEVRKVLSTIVITVVSLGTQFIAAGGQVFTQTINITVTASVAHIREIQKILTIPIASSATTVKNIYKTVSIQVTPIISVTTSVITAVFGALYKNIATIGLRVKDSATRTLDIHTESSALDTTDSNIDELRGSDDAEL